MDKKRIAIIGYGNMLRNDDGLGPVIVEEFIKNEKYAGRHEIEFHVMPQLDIILADRLSDTDLAIFVDARNDEDETLVTVRTVLPSERGLINYHTSHTLQVSDLLELALQWHGKVPDCYLVMPKGVDFELGMDISDIALEAAKEAVIRIDKIISNI